MLLPTVLLPPLAFIFLSWPIYHLIVYPFFLSPLRRLPAPSPLCRITSLWILWKRYRRLENKTIKAAHDRLGPVVMLGPNEVSVNCVKGGISAVYQAGMEKSEWYEVFTNFGVFNMFSTVGRQPHSLRKRILSNTYSKSFLQSSVPLYHQTASILHHRMFPLLARVCDPSQPPSAPYQHDTSVIDVYRFITGLTMDIVTAYLFGMSASSQLTNDPEACKHFLEIYFSRHGFTFWTQETPGFYKLAKFVGIDKFFVPERVHEANNEIEAWTMSMCDGAKRALESGDAMTPEDTPTVYQQMQAAIIKGASKSSTSNEDPFFPTDAQARHVSIASETLDHLAAGFDTSSITLTYLLHELSLPHNQHFQAKLRKELLTLDPPLVPHTNPNTPLTIPDSRNLDALPLLQALLWETLRLHAAIPGPEPRVTPPGGCMIGPGPAADNDNKKDNSSASYTEAEAGGRAYFVPGGVRISASAGVLHANKQVYPEPQRWRPERWLQTEGAARREMDRWFWAFGSGGRMCVGSNLAIYQMKFIVAAIYTNYRTSIVDDEGIEQEDAYTARPKGCRLILKFEPVKA